MSDLASLLEKLAVDDLAQIIRRVDGNHSLGAGQLAEAILAALSPPIKAGEALPVGRALGRATGPASTTTRASSTLQNQFKKEATDGPV